MQSTSVPPDSAKVVSPVVPPKVNCTPVKVCPMSTMFDVVFCKVNVRVVLVRLVTFRHAPTDSPPVSVPVKQMAAA